MVRFGHLVLRTNRLAAMAEWYERVLEARVVAQGKGIVFLSYDEEHHRLALADVGPLGPARNDAPGLAHVAFGLATMDALLEAFERLGAHGIAPARATMHSCTASLYFRDPDDNEVELFTDVAGALVPDVAKRWDVTAAAATRGSR